MRKTIKIFTCHCGKHFNGQFVKWAECSHCITMGRTSGESCDSIACCSIECQENAEQKSVSKNCSKKF